MSTFNWSIICEHLLFVQYKTIAKKFWNLIIIFHAFSKFYKNQKMLDTIFLWFWAFMNLHNICLVWFIDVHIYILSFSRKLNNSFTWIIRGTLGSSLFIKKNNLRNFSRCKVGQRICVLYCDVSKESSKTGF